MPHRKSDTTTRFDRFGWYWQPEHWLAEMSAMDIQNATVNAVDLEKLQQPLQARVERQKQLIDSFTQPSTTPSTPNRLSGEEKS